MLIFIAILVPVLVFILSDEEVEEVNTDPQFEIETADIMADYKVTEQDKIYTENIPQTDSKNFEDSLKADCERMGLRC